MCLLLCLVLLCGPSVAWAQTTGTSGISPIDLKLRLLKLEVKLKTLETAWAEQTISLKRAKQLSIELQNELAELKLSLQNSQALLTSSQEEVARSATLSATLQLRLDNLSTIFDEYETAARRKIITGWIAGGVIGVVLGFVLGRVF